MKYPRASRNERMIFDVGLNTGQDTENYLQMGFDVVAIEANPQLVEQCNDRFKEQIDEGRLTILSGAIVPKNTSIASEGSVEFRLSENEAWGTIAEYDSSEYGSRIAPEVASTIQVPVLDFRSVIEEFGVPYYMKIDIEGADMACLEALQDATEVPAYLSMESDVDSFANVKDELGVLRRLGYTSFQIINQKDIDLDSMNTSHFEYGGSGDFGEWLPDEDWKTATAIERKYRELFVWYHLFSRRGLLRNTPLQRPATKYLTKIMGYTIPSWHDTHARHGDLG